jgi:hypothetical protein
MTDLSELEIYGLWNWLNAATQGLSAESRIRIEKEIRAHFESARESEIATCANPEEAGLSAIISLGDPKAANRAYRKVLLTQADERLLIRFRYNRLDVIYSTAVFLGIALFWIAIGFREFSALNNGQTLLLVLVFFALALRPWIASKRNRTCSRIYSSFYLAGLVGFLFLMDNPQVQLGLFVSFIVIIVAGWPTIRRCQQLRSKLPVEKWPDELFM